MSTVQIISGASAFVLLSLLLSILIKNKSETLKLVLFLFIAIPVIFGTGYLVYSTIHKNVTSVTGGPVHWHADFEIYSCGKKLELVDPEGLSNRVGTSTLHEHNDERIHIEGAIEDFSEISLGQFFKKIGGELNSRSLTVPTKNGIINVKDGDRCISQPGAVQVFVYRTVNSFYFQEKLNDPARYVISHHAQVPPGDCIIIEFDIPKEKSDKLCEQYQIKTSLGEIDSGLRQNDK